MNKRIRELAEQAGLNAPYGSDHEGLRDFDYRKFAELIVQECANHCDLLLDHKMSSEWARGTHDCSKAIKKHFGIEECEHEYDHNGECLKCDEPAWTNSNEPSER